MTGQPLPRPWPRQRDVRHGLVRCREEDPDAGQRLREEGIAGGISVFKSSTDAIAREVDWVIKYQLIERYQASHDLPVSAPQVARADLAYHDVRRGRGLYYGLQRAGAVDRTARDIEIFEAKTVVPPVPWRYRQAG